MTGSLRYFLYTDDKDNEWQIKRDEGNIEAVNPTGDVAAPDPTLPILSRGIEPRKVRYNSADGTTSMEAVLLSNTATALNSLPASVSIPRQGGNVLVYLTSYIGERQKFYPIIDTRQTDADSETAAVG